jgi:hypothetical protein
VYCPRQWHGLARPVKAQPGQRFEEKSKTLTVDVSNAKHRFRKPAYRLRNFMHSKGEPYEEGHENGRYGGIASPLEAFLSLFIDGIDASNDR